MADLTLPNVDDPEPDPDLDALLDDDSPVGSVFARFVGRPRRVAYHRLAVNPEDADRLSEARTALQAATTRANRENAPDGAQHDVDVAQAALDELEASIPLFTFKFEAAGSDEVEKLRNENPPTPEQKARAKESAGSSFLAWNPETYMPALVALCCTEVTGPDGESGVFSDDEWRVAWAEQTATDQMELFNAAAGVDVMGSGVGDMGKGST